MPNPITSLFSQGTHVHLGASGQTIRLNNQEQRELERLERKVSTITQALIDTALLAHPQLKGMDSLPRLAMEALTQDFLGWFLSVDPDQMADDHEMQHMPTILPELADILRQLSPGEARLIRDGLCQGNQLWGMVCKLSPSPALDPHAKVRTPAYDAMRSRYLCWVNAVNRELQATADSSTGSTSTGTTAAARPTPARRTLDPLLLEAAREIRMPHQWGGLGGDIAPHVLPYLKGWPAGRGLEIQNQDGFAPSLFSNGKASGKPPVTLCLDDVTGHYCAVVNGRKVPTPFNGDCLYRAVLVALDPADRQALMQSIGADDRDTFSDDTFLKLREATARQLESGASRFTPTLQLIQIVGQPAPR
ncbi:hypothetical protein [Roseateles amylovorans]|uniref:OTU domain-containing protein n=1 Tax=Roseateles amylovorans TaxID=2978473 RepID=A0ABY6B3P6_9BURK|nr:hypothetical protein [Roseateles amylovorans]UXH79998.1 hypothetical protein N4261_09000 [Roseateles amylovorans]